MFTPNQNAAKAPALAPFLEIDDGKVESFLDGSGAGNDTTKSAYLAICMVLADASKNSTDKDLKDSCDLMFTKSANVSSAESIIDKTKITTKEKTLESVAERAEKQKSSATQWIVDLVTASKKKELTGENVEGYYSALGRTDIRGGPIAKLINSACNFLPDMITDKSFREGLTQNEFMKYHTSRVSTGKLLHEMVDVFKDLKIGDDSVYKLIKDSAESPHDISLSKQVPVKYVGYAALFFEVSNKDVGKWYQGEKALDEIPSVRIKKIKEIFKKYLEIKNEIGNLDSVTQLDELAAMTGNSFF